MKEGALGNRQRTIIYFTDLSGNFMIWLIVELFFKSIFLKRRKNHGVQTKYDFQLGFGNSCEIFIESDSFIIFI